ncbi:MAG: hypothetical protein R3266_11930, partial [Gemmatimonadota bacterium]|nr:hypothetical protein [Gemmatimonadota bacterium]
MEDADATFTALRSILEGYADALTVTRDEPEAYALDAGHSERWDKVLPFGRVEMEKRYVSYHLFPVYVYPALLDELSPELGPRMQGKSCFNFRTLTEAQRRALEELTERCFRRYR